MTKSQIRWIDVHLVITVVMVLLAFVPMLSLGEQDSTWLAFIFGLEAIFTLIVLALRHSATHRGNSRLTTGEGGRERLPKKAAVC